MSDVPRRSFGVVAAIGIAAIATSCSIQTSQLVPPAASLPPKVVFQPDDPPADPPAHIAEHNRHVYVVGDSVLLGTVDTLPQAMRPWKVTMNCKGSRRLPQALEVLRHHRHRVGFGSVVVIQMGNNYIAGEDGTFTHQINQAMHVMRGVPLVVWVTVAKVSSSRRQIDHEIIASAKRYPQIRIANWAPIAARHPNYAYSDGIHLTTSGRIRMSKLIAHVVGPPPRRKARG